MKTITQVIVTATVQQFFLQVQSLRLMSVRLRQETLYEGWLSDRYSTETVCYTKAVRMKFSRAKTLSAHEEK
jgi:hypothetical protein